MNILIVSAFDPTSGVLTVYRSLAQHLAKRGVNYSAFAFDGWRSNTWWTFCDELIDGRTTTLAQMLMTRRFDAIHCIDTTYAPPYGVEKWVARARFKGPVILMAQTNVRELSQPVHATHYVACSPAAAETLAHHADGPVAVIPNGYDEDKFFPGHGIVESRPFLVWVGRTYDPQKNIELFLEVLSLMPDFDAVIIDAGPPDAAIREQIDRLGPRVRHMALLSQEAMAEIFRSAGASGGALISTSRSEGFGLANVEAMASGCPVVAPRIPGHGHLTNGRNALLYEHRDGVQGIIDALNHLRYNGLREKLTSQAGVDAKQHWSSRIMADAYFRFYEEALRASVSASPRVATSDHVVRAFWRGALTVRPAWHRVRRILGR